jgi:hypothetical protein
MGMKNLYIAIGIIGLFVLGLGMKSVNDANGWTTQPAVIETVEPAPVETEPVVTEPEVDVDSLFISTLRDNGNKTIDETSDEDLLQLAHQTCSTLESGTTYKDIALNVIDIAFSLYETEAEAMEFVEFSGMVSGAAVAGYCPEYLDQVYELGGF